MSSERLNRIMFRLREIGVTGLDFGQADDGMEVSIHVPSTVSDAEALESVNELIQSLDQLNRAKGGSGYKVVKGNFDAIEPISIVPDGEDRRD